MRAPYSIRRRLTLLLALVAALLSLLSWAMVTSFARQAAERTQDNVLAASATAIAETLRSEGGELRIDIPYAAFAMLGAISEDRVFYLVTVDGRALTGYADLPTAPVERAGRVGHDTGAYRGDEVRVASLARVVQGGEAPGRVVVTIAQTRAGVGAISGELSTLAAVLSVAFFLTAVALSFIAVRTSLRPLDEIARAVARRGPSDLRPIGRVAPAELAPLLSALNRLMERLGQSLRRSEDFIAEAAHRVRTPLATVRAQAELALVSIEDETERQRLRRMIRAVDESSRSAGQLLDHATVAFRADDLARDRIDLGELARRTVAAMEPTAALKDIDFRVETCPVVVEGDAVLIDHALRNVIDNAVKYSPEDTVVRLTVTQSDGVAEIVVSDRGPGLGDGPVDRLARRFERGRNARGIVGSGLGLTIASDVLGAHGGKLKLGNAEDGRGSCVSLLLPLAG